MNLRDLEHHVPGDGEMPPPPAPRVRQHRERRAAAAPLAVGSVVAALIAVTGAVLTRHQDAGPEARPSATAPSMSPSSDSSSNAAGSTSSPPAPITTAPTVATEDPALDVARRFVRAWRVEGKNRRAALEQAASRRLSNTLADVDPLEVPVPAGDVVLEGHAPQGVVIRVPLRDGSVAVLLVAEDRGALRVIGLSQRAAP